MHAPQRNSFKNISQYCVNFSRARSFAAVKSEKIYIYLQLSRAQTKLSYLSILSIECDIIEYVDVNELFKDFQKPNAAKKKKLQKRFL